jgi:hypothetical protein
MTEKGRGRTKVWSCWASDADGIEFPHLRQVACILREAFSATGEKISKEILRSGCFG